VVRDPRFDAQCLWCCTRRDSSRAKRLEEVEAVRALATSELLVPGRHTAWSGDFDTHSTDLYPYAANWGLKKADADQLLIIGVKTYCPKCEDRVTEELRASGDFCPLALSSRRFSRDGGAFACHEIPPCRIGA
jgi:hypothetical protein